MGTLSGKATLFYFVFASHFIRGQFLKKKNPLRLEHTLFFKKENPFWKSCIVKESKQEVTKVLPLCKNVTKLWKFLLQLKMYIDLGNVYC